jgi:hypothetical protein
VKHRGYRAFRVGEGWQARCSCGRWVSEWVADAEEARQLARVHEVQPEPPDWSIPAAWLDDRRSGT